MAGTLTVSPTRIGSTLYRYQYSWTSDASGNVSGTSADLTFGTIMAVTFNPGTGGSQPTNLYDVTLICDQHGTDLFNDEGLNLTNANGTHHSVFSYNGDRTAFFRQFCHGGGFTLTVANAGNAKSGTLSIYLSQGVV